jgi:hypothetical protein
MSTRNLPGGKGRPGREADNLIAICEPIVKKMWEPQRLTTLWAFKASYRDSFTFLPLPTVGLALNVSGQMLDDGVSKTWQGTAALLFHEKKVLQPETMVPDLETHVLLQLFRSYQ